MKHLDQSVERGTLFSLAAVLILAISVASCGNKQSSAENADNVPVAHSGGKPVDPVTAGSVTGTIRFDGTPPKMKAINMSAVPNCAKMHTEPVMIPVGAEPDIVFSGYDAVMGDATNTVRYLGRYEYKCGRAISIIQRLRFNLPQGQAL
jgi:hypothetical protein